ncbi:hypothetical protein P8S55_04805 [Halomonas sp. M1]|uniref:hypothetical protein n=1 Tax=Halomonas sp. M1 TaxID=3035470 RepID=UPI0024858263|nr:hypothetical protein [Halomonas sp. M1]WFE72417.1 hypothetical protein P8S55_04805 [Halomonas sp. M1]
MLRFFAAALLALIDKNQPAGGKVAAPTPMLLSYRFDGGGLVAARLLLVVLNPAGDCSPPYVATQPRVRLPTS